MRLPSQSTDFKYFLCADGFGHEVHKLPLSGGYGYVGQPLIAAVFDGGVQGRVLWDQERVVILVGALPCWVCGVAIGASLLS